MVHSSSGVANSQGVRSSPAVGGPLAQHLVHGVPHSAHELESLLQILVHGDRRVAIAFAGQGGPAFAELVELWQESASARAWIEAASAAMQGWIAADVFQFSGLYGFGLDLRAWILQAELRPDAGYLASSQISQPLIFLCQILRWNDAAERGLDAVWRSGKIAAVLGHSQGMMPALLISESTEAAAVSLPRTLAYLQYFIWQGLHMAQSGKGLGPQGDATPMAAVAGLSDSELQAHLDAVNRNLDPGQAAVIALYNTAQRFVVSGPVPTLQRLDKQLSTQAAQELKRKKEGRRPGKVVVPTWEYLAVGAPFHSPHMQAGHAAMRQTIADIGFSVDPQKLRLPVYSPSLATSYQEARDANHLTQWLVEDQFLMPVRWTETVTAVAMQHNPEFIVDLGPSDGVAKLTAANLRGRGIETVAIAVPVGRRRLFSAGASGETPLNYQAFMPNLLQLPNGRQLVDNRYSRWTGQSPIILPGMTPTTADAGIVAAAANAGFTAELAGGGQVTEKIWQQRMDELSQLLQPGREFTLNALFLDPYLWDMQVKRGQLAQKARRAGLPLAGVTISAGLPEVDEAVALLDEFRDAGIWLNAFKPGTTAQVEQVIRIAKAASHHTLGLHLEGGKAGGHHSWEDLEQLLVDTYHLIRRQPNLVLCVGGGIATEARAVELLTGSWSLRRGLPAMPVDAVFLGTLAMTCLEATATADVKKALAAATGSPEWVLAGQVRGGVTSGRSQLNADIHYLDNSASRCGRLLDEVAGQADVVRQRHDEIIAALAPTAKPYFGELQQMTWWEVLQRFKELTAIGSGDLYEDGPWLDRSWRERMADLVDRAQARFAQTDQATVQRVWRDWADFDAPEVVLDRLLAVCPQLATEPLHPADRLYFHEVCGRPGKPVPFVPVIDADVRRWFKSDSLWQAQHPKFTADQVLVIPGPEAVAGVRVDEPVAGLLGRFDAAIVAQLQADGAAVVHASDRRLPVVAHAPLDRRVRVESEPGQTILRFSESVQAELWQSWLAAQVSPALAACLLAPAWVSGRRLIRNPLKALLHGQAGATVELHHAEGGSIARLRWQAPRISSELSDSVELTCIGERVRVELQVPAQDGGPTAQLTWNLDLADGDTGTWTVHLSQAEAAEGILGFYRTGLFGGQLQATPLFFRAQADVVIQPTLALAHAALTSGGTSQGISPDYAFSLVWQPMFSVLAAPELAGGLLNLVHLDQQIALHAGFQGLYSKGLNAWKSSAFVTRVDDAATGRTIHVQAELRAGDVLAAELRSQFFVRGHFGNTAYSLREHLPLEQEVFLPDAAAVSLLTEQPWLRLNTPLQPGTTLRFTGNAVREIARNNNSLTACYTTVFDGETVVGQVQWSSHDAHTVHPVTQVLSLLAPPPKTGAAVARKVLMRKADRAPLAMHAFAQAGGDRNPIHRSDTAARLAGLPGAIVHGMWTSAKAHAAIAESLAGGDVTRLTEVQAAFLAPVAPGAHLRFEVARIGAKDGQTQCECLVSALQDGQYQSVVRATASVLPPRTAYVFPGQGIQQKGMGQDGYQRSPAAKSVWDQADAFTRRELGFSILQVVRENPKEIVVSGRRWLLASGVLNLTQFTQVAMAVLAQAQVAEMREAGVLDEAAVACGHSVGEYNALAAYVGVLPLESVVEIVYQRGLAMHTLVPRDASGESGYRMGVIRPNLAGLDHAAAEALVAQVRQESGEFVQIVNYNVRNRQYSVTGRVAALAHLQRALAERTRGDRPAWVEVPGIDVPFHSEVLRDGVPAFRAVLDQRLPKTMPPERLIHRYVPNLVPLPFSLERDFIAAVHAATGSPQLLEVLRDLPAHQAQAPTLARLLLVELLAWQFASPVRWIETQEVLVAPEQSGGLGVRRLLEVGVGYQPTLANMARTSLEGNSAGVQILNAEADIQTIFLRDAAGEPADWPEVTTSIDAVEAPAAQAKAIESSAVAPLPIQAAAAQPSRGTVAVTDVGPDVARSLRSLLALQARVRPDQLRDQETIDELFDGVSSRRNQVLLDITSEFEAGAMDGAHEKPLSALTAELAKRAGTYQAPGRYLRAAQDEAIKKLFARSGWTRKELAGHLTDTWNLAAPAQAHVFDFLAVEGRDGQSGRGGALGTVAVAPAANKAEAVQRIDQFVTAIAAERGWSLGGAAASSSGAAMAVDAAVVAALEAKIAGPDGALMQSVRALAANLGHDLSPVPRVSEVDPQAEQLAILAQEFGTNLADLVRPAFDARKHVGFSSTWSFAQRDLWRLWLDAVHDRVSQADLAQGIQRLAAHGQDPRVRDTARFCADQAKRLQRSDLEKQFSTVAAAEASHALPGLPERPELTVGDDGSLNYREVPDPAVKSWSHWLELQAAGDALAVHAGAATPAIQQALRKVAKEGFDFTGQTALVTGASPGSIALHAVQLLLRGGARVILTTSTYDRERLAAYAQIWQRHAAPGAELHVVPFNQASWQDMDALVDWLFAEITEQAGATIRVLKKPMLPDLILPFAAIKDLATLDRIGVRAQASIRAMLLGVERLVALVGARLRRTGAPRPCHVVLPLSPNHGSFGGDGVYAETKAALEVLMHKWHSEGDAWASALTLCGARIGWVRGTSLMDANDPVAARLEAQTGVRTFSSTEMGLLIAALCCDGPRLLAQTGPLDVDLTGGFGGLADVRGCVDGIRKSLERQVAAARRLHRYRAQLQNPQGNAPAREPLLRLPNWPRRLPTLATNRHDWPKHSTSLENLVVVVGHGEMGPCGTSRTRYELEVQGELSAAGVVELSWLTGLIGWQANGRTAGWVDVQSGQPVAEADIAGQYAPQLRNRVGIRWVEPETVGFDPARLPVMATVYLDQDFRFSVASEAEAQGFIQADPQRTLVQADPSGDRWWITRRAGSEIRVPRVTRLDRRVVGQVPKGFDPTRFGVPKDMADRLDRVTLFNLIATVDAFVGAGLTPEELLTHLHPARVANTQGAGIGGMRSLHRLYVDHLLGNERQNDVLQETLINVVAGYVVQSYVGSYGSMAHPVGACATAAVSMEEAYDKISLRRADFVVAGGYDDYGQEGAVGFADMAATASSDEMTAMGLEPDQMSRANDVRRRGFVEGQGGGTLLVTRGDIALALGLPVRAVLAFAGSYGDGIHKSIPAPGMGALASALGGMQSPLAQALHKVGLKADDITVVSKHDTSTGANDPNENALHHRIQTALGRTLGNPLLVISQKSLTGHSKGGAAAWQTIGLCQVLQTGQVPGNRNLQSVDAAMRRYQHVAFSDSTVAYGPRHPVRAGLATSLGFGHVGALLLLVHPDAFHSAVPEASWALYSKAVSHRNHLEFERLALSWMGIEPAYEKRAHRRFDAADGTDAQAEAEAKLLLDPDARLGANGLYGAA